MKLVNLLAAGTALTALSTGTVVADEAAEATISDMAAFANGELAARGYNIVVEYAEIIYGADEGGVEIFFNNRGNKQLTADWVPGDPRRDWNDANGAGPDGISYAKETVLAPAANVTLDVANDAIDRSMATWDAQNCSGGLMITDAGEYPFLSIGLFIPGFPFPPLEVADINHGGWVSGLGDGVLGATFTAVWVDPTDIDPDTGQPRPTDIDNNGMDDVAFRIILYSQDFTWNDDGTSIDVETVALHEAGHALSQAHFGKLFQNNKNGKFHFAPRAVMNAGYTGVQRTLAGTDNGGHCSNWGNWPNN